MRKADKALKKLKKQGETDGEVANIEAKIAKYLQLQAAKQHRMNGVYTKEAKRVKAHDLKRQQQEKFTLIDRATITASVHKWQTRMAKRWSTLMKRVTKFAAYQASLCKLLKKVCTIRVCVRYRDIKYALTRIFFNM